MHEKQVEERYTRGVLCLKNISLKKDTHVEFFMHEKHQIEERYTRGVFVCRKKKQVEERYTHGVIYA